MIQDIEVIVKRHESVQKTLDDIEGRPALLMCLHQIGETLFRLENIDMRAQLPVTEAYTMRNIIAHSYLGVNDDIISQTVDQDLPELNLMVQRLLQNP
ncbi:MAG: DUF86 domain-containing protein [Spirochaetales bacterium]|nr:DUF86 domain-containing protein [Spirochaetales bacterium]